MQKNNRIMTIAKWAISIIVLAVGGFFIWNYLAGPLKYQRDMHAFAENLATCETYSADIYMPLSGAALNHAIDGLQEDGSCHVRIEALGAHEVRCAFATSDLPELSRAFADFADALDMFGGTSFQISTSNPDPLSRALNSDACTTVAM